MRFTTGLTSQLSNDFHVRRVIRDYFLAMRRANTAQPCWQWDRSSIDQPPTDSYVDSKPTVRIGLVQWQMRPYVSVDDLFVAGRVLRRFRLAITRAISSSSQSIFVRLLMAHLTIRGEAQSIRMMAQYTDEYLADRFLRTWPSVTTSISSPVVCLISRTIPSTMSGFLCRRDGSVDMYEKIQVTPDEQKCWGLSGGSHIQTFDTDCGKIGIVICYDVEFLTFRVRWQRMVCRFSLFHS